MTTLAVIGVGRLVKPLKMGDKIRVNKFIYQRVYCIYYMYIICIYIHIIIYIYTLNVLIKWNLTRPS